MEGLSIIVRAITYFTRKVENLDDIRDEIEHGLNVIDEIHELLVKRGYMVFTKRVALPPGSLKVVSKAIEYLDEDVLLSAGFIENGNEKDIVESALNGVYTPILHNGPLDIIKARRYSNIIHEASSQDPVAATRISIGFHETGFLTPYFPDSSSRGERAIGLAFLYPNALLKLLEKGMSVEWAIETLFREFDRLALEIRGEVGLDTYIDYSLSPWMENSVVKVFRAIGADVARPGFNYTLNLVNNLIEKHVDQGLKTGFNEVMLPYAEDLELMRLGESGLLRARDFLLYASTCVAGVDMIVVPEDVETLARLIADTASIAIVKRKPTGFRAIPVGEKPGNRVKLGKFGEITVIDY
ncbi:MAG: DUF711 family protein [Desulfurococcaceae archaeon]